MGKLSLLDLGVIPSDLCHPSEQRRKEETLHRFHLPSPLRLAAWPMVGARARARMFLFCTSASTSGVFAVLGPGQVLPGPEPGFICEFENTTPPVPTVPLHR